MEKGLIRVRMHQLHLLVLCLPALVALSGKLCVNCIFLQLFVWSFGAKQVTFMPHLTFPQNHSPTPNSNVFSGGQSTKGYSCDPYLVLDV